MPLKTLFTTATATIVAIGAGTLTYDGIDRTKEQVFYSCTGPFGQAKLVNPNRYAGGSSLHVAVTSNDGAVRRYEPVLMDPPELKGDISGICRTGQISANLRPER